MYRRLVHFTPESPVPMGFHDLVGRHQDPDHSVKLDRYVFNTEDGEAAMAINDMGKTQQMGRKNQRLNNNPRKIDIGYHSP